MELMASRNVSLWNKSIDVYKEVVGLLNDEKRKRKKGKLDEKDTLSYLDKWYQEDLPTIVKSRDPPHLTQDELCQLMKWKLTRGKFRPRLTDYIKENDPQSVIRLTSDAYSQIPDVHKAIETLTKLKGVGPATASAILCLHYPELCPFMSDESTQAVSSIGKLDYSLKQYLAYIETLQAKAEELGKTWNAHKVELALWSYHFANQLKPDLLTDVQLAKDVVNEQSEDDDVGPSIKKFKPEP